MSFMIDRYYQMLERHKIYKLLNNQTSLANFMERHVVCVWVYHSLLRSLYQDIVSQLTDLNGDRSKECLRLITEIVLEEVVEDLGDGQYQSHLELYVEAMEDLGANITPILTFFDMLEKGYTTKRSLELANFPIEAVRYAKTILPLLKEPPYKKAAALFYEGEPFIPDSFLTQVEVLLPKVPVNLLLDYFEGHIEGLKRPGFSATGRLVEIFCASDKRYELQAEKIAEKVMKSRLELWNLIATDLDTYADPEPVLRVLTGGKQFTGGTRVLQPVQDR